MATNTVLDANRSPIVKIAVEISELGFGAAAGALAGYAFNIINPIGGALFGATFGLANAVGKGMTRSLVADDDSAGKTALYVISYFGSVAAGAFVASTLGFSLSVMGGVWMSLAMLLTAIPVNIVASCCFSEASGSRSTI